MLVDAMGRNQDRRLRRVWREAKLPRIDAGVNIVAGERLDANVRAVRAVVDAARASSRLPARRALFAAPGVACRA